LAAGAAPALLAVNCWGTAGSCAPDCRLLNDGGCMFENSGIL
jgi:hypothetical protein